MKWNPKYTLALTGLVLGAVGAGSGYLTAYKILEKKFEERLDREIQDAKAFYQDMYSTPAFVEHPKDDETELLEGVKAATKELDGIPEDLVGNALSAIRTYRADDEDEKPDDPRPPVIVQNFFETHQTPPGEEVLEALMADRDPNTPYIITKEEFYDNEPEHEQIQFTFWEGDGVLVDDREEFTPIENIELVVGEENLLRFGYGSGDENVLYVRNEAVKPPMDLHITKSTGKYSVEVLALDDGSPHLEHSKPRKFRTYDE